MHYVINADDFGMDEETSAAIIQAFVEKRINRTTAMVNMAYFTNAFEESIKNGFASNVGLHLNLTKGVPLTEKIREIDLFCNQDGFFNGKCMKNSISRLVPFSKEIKNAVYEEIEAQFKKFIEYYGQKCTYHCDSHHHVHKNMNILPLYIEIAKKYGFKTMRFAKASGTLVNCCYNGIVNHKIQKQMGIQYCELYVSINDYLTRNEKTHSIGCFEVECHPKAIDGVLYDGEIQMPMIECYSNGIVK